MATTVDERIVAAKFDASDFEKGVDKTIKKLDELKKELNFKDATKGVKELAEKTEVSTNSMSKSLEKLTDRFTTFTGMIKQKILSGLADEVAGVFLKMEMAVKSFIKSISTDQIGAGMYKYEEILRSVRIMMSAGETEEAAYEQIDRLREYSDQTSYSLSQMTDALSKLRAAGVGLEPATNAVMGIANACANAGINATDAARAFYNLSQAYGSGRLYYTDYRSLEMMNLTTAEFKENMLEAAVAAGTLKKVKDGVYKTTNKTDKKVTAGKTVTVKNVRDALKYNFMNTEAMNKLFGEKYFGFNETEYRKYLAKYNNDREKAIEAAKKDFGDLAVESYLAAREARSLTDVFNTLKDVVSTGWSNTFEQLFGKLEVATKFFTELVDGPLADVIYKIGEYRNAILEAWNVEDAATGEGSGGQAFRETIMNITEALGTFLKTILSVLPGFEELYGDVEEHGTPTIDSLGESLFKVSIKIRDFSRRLKEAANNFNTFMHEKVFDNNSVSRIEKIREIFTNLSSVVSIFGKIFVIAISGIAKAFKTLSPIFDGLLIIIDKITEPLVSLKDDTTVFNNIEHSINNILTIIRPIAEVLGQIIGFLGEVAGFFAQMAIDTVTTNIAFLSDTLGIFLELFTGNSAQMKSGEGVLARIKADFEGIKQACEEGLGALKEFFTSLIGDIKELLGLEDEAEEKSDGEKKGGIFSRLTAFFETNEFVQSAKAWVDKAITDVSNFIQSIPERLKELGANIYDTIYNLFFTEQTKYNGSTLETKTILTPLGEWVKQAIEDAKNFVKSIPQKIVDGIGKIGSWIDTIFNAIFGTGEAQKSDKPKQQAKTTKTTKEADEHKAAIMERFEAFIQEVKTSISDWFKDLPDKLKAAFGSVGSFISKLISTIDDFIFGKKTRKKIDVVDKDGKIIGKKTITTRYKTGFSKFIDGVIKDIKEFIKNIPKYIKDGIKGAGDIVSAIVKALFGGNDNKDVTNKDVEDKIAAPFLGIDISNILKTIADIGKEILNQIARIFTGTDDIDFNMNWFAETIASGIDWIRTKAEEGIPKILEYLGKLPTDILNLFTGENKDNAESGPIGEAIVKFGQAIGKFITEDLPNTILNFIDSATNAFSDIWDHLYNLIIGGGPEDDARKSVNKLAADLAPSSTASDGSISVRVASPWEKFVARIGQTISNIWQELPTWIAQGIDMAVVGIGDLISNIGNWIGGTVSSAEANGSEKEVTKATSKAVSNYYEVAANSLNRGVSTHEPPRLIKAIRNIGEHLKNLFVEIIPGFISKAWTKISGLGSEIWEGFKSIFTGEVPDSEIGKAINAFGTNVYNFIINDIPNAIKNGFKFVKELITGKNPYDETFLESIPNPDWAKYAKDYMDKAKKDLHKDDPGTSFFDTIKESFKNAALTIGPVILNAITTALGFIGDIATIIGDILIGNTSVTDLVDEKFGGKSKELRTALSNVGEAIRKFIMETLPTLIGSAIGFLATKAPEWFEKLFGAINKAGENAEKKNGTGKKLEGPEGVAENAMSFLGNIMNFFKQIQFNDATKFAQVAVTIVLVIMVLSRLKDLFSVGWELEEVGKTVKWSAILVGILALAGIVSAIVDLSKTGNETQIQNFKDILDKVAGVFEKIAWIVGLVSAGKLSETVGEFASKGGDKGAGLGTKILDGLGGMFSGFMGTIAVGAGAYVSSGFVGAAIETTMTSITSALNELTSGVEEALQLVMPFIDDLVKLDSKMNTAINVMDKIGQLFSKFMTSFGELYVTSVSGTKMIEHDDDTNQMAKFDLVNTETNKRIAAGPVKETLSMGAYIVELESRVDLFLQLSAFVEHLINALDKMGQLDDMEKKIDDLDTLLTKEDKLKTLFTHLFQVLDDVFENTDFGVVENFSQFGSVNPNISRNVGLVFGIEMLGSALSIVASAMTGLDEKDVNAFDGFLEVIKKLYESLGDVKVNENALKKAFFGDNSISVIGKELKRFGFYVKGFYSEIKDIEGFKESEVEETKSKTKAIVELAGELATAMKDMVYGSSAENLEQISEKLPSFGTAAGEFFTNLNRAMPEELTSERAENLLKATASMALLLESINNLAGILSFRSGSDLSEILGQIFDTKTLNGDYPSQLAGLIKVMDEGILRVMESEDFLNGYDTIGHNMAQKLYEGIQSAFDEDETLRPVITPVFNMDEIRKQLGLDVGQTIDLGTIVSSVIGANNQTDEEIIRASELYPKLDKIDTSINEFAGKTATVENVTDAFTRMRIITDTGVLAGEIVDQIDELIGRKIWLITNNISNGE